MIQELENINLELNIKYAWLAYQNRLIYAKAVREFLMDERGYVFKEAHHYCELIREYGIDLVDWENGPYYLINSDYKQRTIHGYIRELKYGIKRKGKNESGPSPEINGN